MKMAYSRLSLHRTKLSKALITDPAKVEWRSAADLKIKYGTNNTARCGNYAPLTTLYEDIDV